MYSQEKKRRPIRRLREVVPREKPQALVERITDSDSEEGDIVGEEVYFTKQACGQVKKVGRAGWLRKGWAEVTKIVWGGRSVGLRYRSLVWVGVGLWIGVQISRLRPMVVTCQVVCDCPWAGANPSTSPPGTTVA